MTNNDIFRRLRFIFHLSNTQVQEVFALVEQEVGKQRISSWLKKDDDKDQRPIKDKDLAAFLNGLIILRRGKREGELPVAESKLTHNLILRKLKIAFAFQSEDMLAVWKEAHFNLSKHELSAFFRKPGHRHYRECKDQILRNFLQGLALRNREK